MFLSKFTKVLIKLIKMILGEKIIKSRKYGKLKQNGIHKDHPPV